MSWIPKGVIVILLAGGFGVAAQAFRQGRQQQLGSLDRIMSLQARLELHNQQEAQQAASTVRMIGYYWCLKSFSARDGYLLKNSRNIQARTQSLVDTLRALQRGLRRAGNESDLGPLHRPGTPARLPKADILALGQHLARFTKLVEKFVPPGAYPDREPYRPVATWWFAKNYSPPMPLTAWLGVLTQLEFQIQRNAGAALATQAEKSGRSVDWFDTVRAIEVAESETVAPGSVYKARLYLNDNNLHYCKSITVDGQSAESIRETAGWLALKAPRRPPGKPGIVPAQCRVIIQARANPELKPYRADSTWQLIIPYFIESPRHHEQAH